MLHADVRRRTALWVVGLLAAASQIVYLPEKARFLHDSAALARMTPEESEREAMRPVDPELLRWVAARTRPSATLLLVTPESEPRRTSSYVLFHRALVELYPRRIVWVARGGGGWPRWWIVIPQSEEALRHEARSARASAVLFFGFRVPTVTGRTESFSSVVHLVFLERRR